MDYLIYGSIYGITSGLLLGYIWVQHKNKKNLVESVE